MSVCLGVGLCLMVAIASYRCHWLLIFLVSSILVVLGFPKKSSDLPVYTVQLLTVIYCYSKSPVGAVVRCRGGKVIYNLIIISAIY